MIAMSVGLMQKLLTDHGFQSVMQGGVIRIYPGPRVSTPEAGIGLAPVAEMTQDGAEWQPAPNNAAGGLQLNMVSGVFLEMKGQWIATGVAAGEGAWWRWTGPDGDTGGNSDTLPRIDGDCGTDLVLPSYVFAVGSTQQPARFVVGFPRIVS